MHYVCAIARVSAANHTHSNTVATCAADEEGTNVGMVIHDQISLNKRVSDAHAAGYRIEMHVIGDRAAEMGLTALEAAGITVKDRAILTHCQVLRADLMERMAAIGVIADVQPQFTTSDARYVDRILPQELLPYSYAWKTLLKYGIHVAGGSDSPVETPSPFIGLHAALFRPVKQYVTPHVTTQQQQTNELSVVPFAQIAAQEREAHEKGDEAAAIESWRATECLSMSEALSSYTLTGGYTASAGMEGKVGMLEAGRLADFVVLDRDIVRYPHSLLRVNVLQVWVGAQRKQ